MNRLNVPIDLGSKKEKKNQGDRNEVTETLGSSFGKWCRVGRVSLRNATDIRLLFYIVTLFERGKVLGRLKIYRPLVAALRNYINILRFKNNILRSAGKLRQRLKAVAKSKRIRSSFANAQPSWIASRKTRESYEVSRHTVLSL